MKAGGRRHTWLTLSLLVLSIGPMLLLSGCCALENTTRSITKAIVYFDELLPTAESSRYLISRKRNSECNYSGIDGKRKKWVIDISRLKSEDYSPG